MGHDKFLKFTYTLVHYHNRYWRDFSEKKKAKWLKFKTSHDHNKHSYIFLMKWKLNNYNHFLDIVCFVPVFYPINPFCLLSLYGVWRIRKLNYLIENYLSFHQDSNSNCLVLDAVFGKVLKFHYSSRVLRWKWLLE